VDDAVLLANSPEELGWWLDNALTLDDHTTQMAQKIAAASARVGRMGGRPGGLPVRTAFHLWASLALPRCQDNTGYQTC